MNICWATPATVPDPASACSLISASHKSWWWCSVNSPWAFKRGDEWDPPTFLGVPVTSYFSYVIKGCWECLKIRPERWTQNRKKTSYSDETLWARESWHPHVEATWRYIQEPATFLKIKERVQPTTRWIETRTGNGRVKVKRTSVCN